MNLRAHYRRVSLPEDCIRELGWDAPGCAQGAIGLGLSPSLGGYVPFTFDQLGDAWWIDPVGTPASVTYAADPGLVNGGFEAGTTGWTPFTSTVLTAPTVDPYEGSAYLRVTDTSTTGYAYQSVLIVGNRYATAGVGRGNGVNSFPALGDGAANRVSGTTSTAWQSLAVDWSSGNARFQSSIGLSGGSGYVEFDALTLSNLSVAAIEAKGVGLNRCNDGRVEYSGVTAWTAVNAATLTKEAGTPYEGTQCLRVAYSTTSNPYATQIILTTGHTYRIRGYARSDGSKTPVVYVGTGSIDWSGTTSTDWQAFDVTAVADNTTFALQSSGSGAGYVEFDDISVIDLDDPCGSIVQASATAQSWVDPDTGWIRYDGAADNNASNLPVGAFDFLHDGRPWSLGGVFKLTALSYQSLLGNMSTSSNFGALLGVDPTGKLYLYQANGTGTYATVAASAAGVVAAGVPFVVTASYSGSGSIKVWLDGVLVIDATPGALIAGPPSYTMKFGTLGGGGTWWYYGSQADIMLRPSAFTDAERANVERMLSQKHGIPLAVL